MMLIKFNVMGILLYCYSWNCPFKGGCIVDPEAPSGSYCKSFYTSTAFYICTNNCVFIVTSFFNDYWMYNCCYCYIVNSVPLWKNQQTQQHCSFKLNETIFQSCSIKCNTMKNKLAVLGIINQSSLGIKNKSKQQCLINNVLKWKIVPTLSVGSS